MIFLISLLAIVVYIIALKRRHKNLYPYITGLGTCVVFILFSILATEDPSYTTKTFFIFPFPIILILLILMWLK